jgi:hypothetical protein
MATWAEAIKEATLKHAAAVAAADAVYTESVAKAAAQLQADTDKADDIRRDTVTSATLVNATAVKDAETIRAAALATASFDLKKDIEASKGMELASAAAAPVSVDPHFLVDGMK